MIEVSYNRDHDYLPSTTMIMIAQVIRIRCQNVLVSAQAKTMWKVTARSQAAELVERNFSKQFLSVSGGKNHKSSLLYY